MTNQSQVEQDIDEMNFSRQSQNIQKSEKIKKKMKNRQKDEKVKTDGKAKKIETNSKMIVNKLQRQQNIE